MYYIHTCMQGSARVMSNCCVLLVQAEKASMEEAIGQADARALAAERGATQRVAETAVLAASLRAELADARASLDAAHARVSELGQERARGLQHVEGLRAQLARMAAEATRLRHDAAPRIRQRLVLAAK